MFCQVPVDAVISVHDVSNLYRVPLLLLQQGALKNIARKLMLPLETSKPTAAVEQWSQYADKVCGK